MSMEFIAISGLGVTIISVGVALAALILHGHRNQQKEITSLRIDIGGLREEIIGLRERVAHLEGLIEGLREAIAGRRVAEEAGKYQPR